MNSISYLPIIVASLVAFGISSFWYSPFLFGKEWMTLNKTSPKDAEKGRVLKSYLIQFILTLITFSVLGFIITMSEVSNGTDGAFVGILAWIGFTLPISASSFLWKKESFTLVLIEAVNNLVILTIGGAILGAWK